MGLRTVVCCGAEQRGCGVRGLALPVSPLPPSGPSSVPDRKLSPVSILDDLANPPKRQVPFTEWLIAQTPEIRAALEEAAVDYNLWSDTSLELLLRKYGASCSKYSVREWRASVAAR